MPAVNTQAEVAVKGDNSHHSSSKGDHSVTYCFLCYPQDGGFLPSEANAAPVFIPAVNTQAEVAVKGDNSHHSSSKGDHSVTEDVDEESEGQ